MCRPSKSLLPRQNYRIILTKQPCGASESALPMLLQAASAVLPAQSEPSDSLLGVLSEKKESKSEAVGKKSAKFAVG